MHEPFLLQDDFHFLAMNFKCTVFSATPPTSLYHIALCTSCVTKSLIIYLSAFIILILQQNTYQLLHSQYTMMKFLPVLYILSLLPLGNAHRQQFAQRHVWRQVNSNIWFTIHSRSSKSTKVSSSTSTNQYQPSTTIKSSKPIMLQLQSVLLLHIHKYQVVVCSIEVSSEEEQGI